MIYAVIPLADPNYDLLGAVKQIDSGAYVDYAPRVYFVRFNGTASSLAKAVGFSEDSHSLDGVVTTFEDFFGYGNADLWGWLDR